MRVLVSDDLSEEGLEVLRQAEGIDLDNRAGLSEDELAAAVDGAHGLVIRSGSKVSARVLESTSSLKVVGRAGIGVDNVDVEAASARGVLVMNTPFGNTITTAEHAIALMMSLARNVPQATAALKEGRWEKKKLEGIELCDKTLGVIGLGNIGSIVADRGQGLKMNVIAYDPVIPPEKAVALGVELVDLDALWARADVITVHTPLNDKTRHLVNAEMVGKLKRGVLLINAARGGIYDHAALLTGLEEGIIGGVALDVYPEEPPPKDEALLQHPRVICTPHLGASTGEAQVRVAVQVAEQVVAFLKDGTVTNGINADRLG